MDATEKDINVGLLVAWAPAADDGRLREFANQAGGGLESRNVIRHIALFLDDT